MAYPARRVAAIAALIVGVLAITVAALALRHDRSTPSTFGTAQPAPSVTASATSASPTAGVGSTTSAAPVTTPAAPTSASGLEVAALPARLSIETLHVSAPVESVETTDGVLGVPEDPATVGWWTGSAPPGAPSGTAVIDGHVDSAVTGIGALFYIRNLAAGDTVTVTTTAGTQLRYRVTARSVFVKHQGLPASLFTRTGPPRLLLITCGGPFDRAARSYLDNIVVAAEPIAA